MATLHTLHPAEGARKPRKRVGRGPGSGHGKTSSRGHKGLKARSGGHPAPGFEGGQMPLQRRLPKRGFTNIFKIHYQIVNVQDLNTFSAHTVITSVVLQEAGKIKSIKKPVKILGNGDLTVSLTVHADKFSQTARQKIVAAGGVVEERLA
jgi:large subunit ribosomal protein L15